MSEELIEHWAKLCDKYSIISIEDGLDEEDARFQEDEQIVVVLNNSKELKQITVPVWLSGIHKEGRMKRLIYTYEEGYTTAYDEYIVENGEIVLNMGRHSAAVLKPVRPAWF